MSYRYATENARGEVTTEGLHSRGDINVGGDANIEGDVNLESDLVIGVAGKGLKVAEGTDAKMGIAILVAGIGIINTTAIAPTSRVFFSRQNNGGTLGELYLSNVVAGVSFRIRSTSTTETSAVAWIIIDPA